MYRFWVNKPHFKYRNDIDGLRSISVFAVIAFHFGILTKGYLGVDVFFVISGYLITSIIYKEIEKGSFSFKEFYLRRIRRILPLSLLAVNVALFVGCFTMLPDDLENLSQSVIATNLFSNNILAYITVGNYWEAVNEFKPLMHTWSLSVEEQFYFIYPAMLLLFQKNKKILLGVSLLTSLSLLLYLVPYFSVYAKFYLIVFRFWEISAGGLVALLQEQRSKKATPWLKDAALLLIVGLFFIQVPAKFEVLFVVLATIVLLREPDSTRGRLSSFLLGNKAMVYLGKISFSLYIWHQILLAYTRYFITQDLSILHYCVIFALTCALSVISYTFVESPFRKKSIISNRMLVLSLGAAFCLSSGLSAYTYFQAGVLRDVPELDLKKADAIRGMHASYNSKIYGLNKDFIDSSKTRVFIVGNSYARDWANLLLESKFAERLEISYVVSVEDPSFEKRAAVADVIFTSDFTGELPKKFGDLMEKLWFVGVKNFGTSNGIFYNYSGPAYFEQRTKMEAAYLKLHRELSKNWGTRYLSFVDKVIDNDDTVPVFTPDKKFISQDCRHLTRAGARYFSELFVEELSSLFGS